jgi:Anti-sigma-K factor rskA
MMVGEGIRDGSQECRAVRTGSTAAAEQVPAVASVPPWYRRVAFWRAVAGMAFAIAIACAVVAAEFSSALIERTRHYHNRLHQLSSNLTAMRGEIASADREIAGMRTAVEVDDGWRQIIAEPDARLIRLEAPGHATGAGGVIAFSPGLRRAAIEIGGVPVLPSGRAYTLWWICGKRGALKAARIGLRTADKTAVMITLPAGGEAIEGAIVTVDSQPSTAKPSGDTVLRGTVAPSRLRPDTLKRR